MIDAALLDEFAHRFYGYGSWEAPVWFIGMEEAGVNDVEQFLARVQAWISLGKPALADLADFHSEIQAAKVVAPDAPLQRTWRPLIRATLIARGVQPTQENMRAYQATNLGRTEADTALLELSPFPNRSTRHWAYDSLGFSRSHAAKSFRPERQKRLMGYVELHRPAVVFYGNRRYWTAELSLTQHSPQISEGRHGATKLLATVHPVARQSTNLLWDTVGKLLAEVL